ncbi:histidine phosphatase family protein [Opitutaceae bacterium]|nr:histidine phosphatase family protein [Opitutaceae bacterium]
MRLFLIRHAHALPHEIDAERPVSERGQAITRLVSAYFKKNGKLTPKQVWHSPLQRAFETAADLVSQIGLDCPLVETAGLEPADDPKIVAERMKIYPATHDIAMVGHQPHLNDLASLLVSDSSAANLFHFKKNTVLALRRTDDSHPKSGLPRWRVAWHFSPELLPGFETFDKKA